MITFTSCSPRPIETAFSSFCRARTKSKRTKARYERIDRGKTPRSVKFSRLHHGRFYEARERIRFIEQQIITSGIAFAYLSVERKSHVSKLANTFLFIIIRDIYFERKFDTCCSHSSNVFPRSMERNACIRCYATILRVVVN